MSSGCLERRSNLGDATIFYHDVGWTLRRTRAVDERRIANHCGGHSASLDA